MWDTCVRKEKGSETLFVRFLCFFLFFLAALAEASVIVREHTPLTNLFMCLWFNEVARFTARDQLSFGYVLRKLKRLHLNLFPVCTRRALINPIGHQRKAKMLPVQGRSRVRRW